MKFLQISALVLFLGVGFQINAQSTDRANQLSVGEVKEAEQLTHLIDDDDIGGTIESFEVTIKYGGSANLHIQLNQGDRFGEELKGLFQKVNEGTKIWIDRVTIKEKDRATAKSFTFLVAQ